LLELYGLQVSPDLISTVTDEVLAAVANFFATYSKGWSDKVDNTLIFQDSQVF
jgi:predicted ribosome quality control (RQC) complex YloA/Tae2 family protein